jgi:O-antigen ligase
MYNKIVTAKSYCMMALPYLLIFTETATNVLIGLLALLTLAECVSGRSWKINARDLLIAVSPYLVTTAGMFYTSESQNGWREMEIRASLLVFPLLFSLKESTFRQRTKFFSHLCYALIVSLVVALVLAVYRNNNDLKVRDDWFIKWYYQYNDFTDPLGIDPMYISFYLGFACILLIVELLNSQIELTEIPQNLKMVGLGLMLIFLTMIGTRSWMIITFVAALSLLFLTWTRSVLRLRVAIFGLLFIAVGLAFVLPVTRDRFMGTFAKQWEFTDYTLDRIIIWSTAGSDIKENPLNFIFGCGTGCSTHLMEGLYRARNIAWDFEQKTNTHNQYLNIVLNQGFVGLVVFLGYQFYSLSFFIRNKSWAGFYFFLLLSVGLFTENYLDRQKGVVFIGFTYALLFFQSKSDAEIQHKTEKLKQ